MGTKSYIYRGTGDLDPLKPTESETLDAQPLTVEPQAPVLVLRTEAGTYAPGQSGNVAGRPPKAVELDRMLREKFPPEYIAECYAVILADPSRQDYFSALREVANRMYGTPTQKIDVSLPEDDIRHQVIAARIALLSALMPSTAEPEAIDGDYKELPEGQSEAT